MIDENVLNSYCPIQGHTKYGISPAGNVINFKTKRILKQEIVDGGYRRVRIDDERFYVHKLVAEAFRPNPENKKYVLHKNHDRSDNKYTNLVWSNNYIYDHP